MYLPHVRIVENLNLDAPFSSFPQTGIHASHWSDDNSQIQVSSVIYVLGNERTINHMAYDLNILTDLRHKYIESPFRCIISTASNTIYVEHNLRGTPLSTLIQMRENERRPFSLKEIFTCGVQVLSALMYIYNPRKRCSGVGPFIPVCNITDISTENIVCNESLTSFSLANLWMLIPEVAQYVPIIRNAEDIDRYITDQLCCILFKMATFKDMNPTMGRNILNEINMSELKRVFEKSCLANHNDRWSTKQIFDYMMHASGIRHFNSIECSSLGALVTEIEQLANSEADNVRNNIDSVAAEELSKLEELQLIKEQNESLAREIETAIQQTTEAVNKIELLESEITASQLKMDEELAILEDAKKCGQQLITILKDRNYIIKATDDNASELFAAVNTAMIDVSNTFNKLRAIQDLPEVQNAGGIRDWIQQYKNGIDDNNALFRQYTIANDCLNTVRAVNTRLRDLATNNPAQFVDNWRFYCLFCQNNEKNILCKKCNNLIFCDTCFNALIPLDISCPKCNEADMQSFEKVFSA